MRAVFFLRAFFVLTSTTWTVSALADEAGGGAGAASGIVGMVPFVAMFAVVYLLMVRPAQQQRLKQEQLLDGLKKDDEVVTQSGLVGRIVAIEDSLVSLEIADKVRVRMLRDRITGPYAPAAGQVALKVARPPVGKSS